MAYGDGSIYQRTSDQRWVATYRHNGKRGTVYGKTRREARERRNAAVAEIEAGLDLAGGRQTLAVYLAWWIDTVKGPHAVQKATYRSYAYALARVVGLIGDEPLKSLRPDQIQTSYTTLARQGLAPATVNLAHTVLRAALGYAAQSGLITRNPADAVKLPAARKRAVTRWTDDELTLFLASTRTHRLWPLWVTLAMTGLRIGEALGLSWEDVGDSHLHIRHSAHYVGRERWIGDLKSPAALRDIPLTTPVREALAQRRLDQKRERLAAVHWEDSDLVFTATDGRQTLTANVIRPFHDEGDRLGLPSIRLHDLRHMYASRGAAAGINPAEMQYLLGHSSIAMTLGLYTHVERDQIGRAAGRLAAFFEESATNRAVNGSEERL